MVCVGLLVFVLFPAASEGTRKVNQLGAAAVKAGIKPCGPKRGDRPCCGDGKCDAPEDEITCMADCPGVQTTEMCGEEPHSDRGGKGLTFGVSHRAKSAQDCCDKCSASTRGCNSWTFCGYPVCFGLDTGWNHTYGECWLRKLEDPNKPTFGQRGEYAMRYRRKMLRTRRSCTDIDTPGGMSPVRVRVRILTLTLTLTLTRTCGQICASVLVGFGMNGYEYNGSFERSLSFNQVRA